MPAAGAIFLLAILLAASGFTIRAFERAQANDRLLPQRQDWALRRPRLAARSAAADTVIADSGKPVRRKTRGKQQTVRAIIAAGVTDNWVARQQHRRDNGQVPLRRRAFHRLVFPGRREKPPPAQLPAPVPDPVPGPSPARGAPMTETTATTTASSNGRAASSGGGGSAGDFFHAQDRMLQEAANGGLKSKVRAHLALGEGFPQQAAALEQYAQHLQDNGEYPSFVWEPVRRAAQFLKSAGAAMAESGSAIASIAKTPAGELQGKAPAREELNKA